MDVSRTQESGKAADTVPRVEVREEKIGEKSPWDIDYATLSAHPRPSPRRRSFDRAVKHAQVAGISLLPVFTQHSSIQATFITPLRPSLR